MTQLTDIGVIGLAVMGKSLAINLERNGFKVSVYNRNTAEVDTLLEEFPEKNFVGCRQIEDFVKSLSRPRKVLLMIKAGDPVDQVIEQLLPYLEQGDIVIDGGNSNFNDSERRVQSLYERGIYFVGLGVSGGEEGALYGPSLMPGGAIEAKDALLPILTKIAAKAPDGSPCCAWVGNGGSGHYVKMIHNGIEYGDMQLIAEAYLMMKTVLGMDNLQIADSFEKWNEGDLSSYLIEITGKIFRRRDTESGDFLIDKILDTAGQKGTGKWAVINSLDHSTALTLIATAVYERSISAMKDLRTKVHGVYGELPRPIPLTGEGQEKIAHALYAAKLVSYAQGFQLMRTASNAKKWDLDLASVARIWRGGCIIRSVFLNKIAQAYEENPDLDHLLLAPYFVKAVKESLDDWREVIAVAAQAGIPQPSGSAALHYLYSLSSERLPANLLQAQRDYFGAHMFERIDFPRGKFFHEDWADLGTDSQSSVYVV